MMTRPALKKLSTLSCAILLALLGFALVFSQVSPVAAQTRDDVCEGVTFTGASECGAGDTGAQDSLNTVVENGLNIVSIIVGIIAVAMIIFGGFKYITAGGDSSKISSAQQTIIYAIVGLVIVALAQIIVRFVLTNVT